MSSYVGDGDTPLHVRARAGEAITAGDRLGISNFIATKIDGGPYIADKAAPAGDVFMARFVGATSIPTTSAVVANGQAMQVPVTGAYVDTVTFTVANGEITGIALS